VFNASSNLCVCGAQKPHPQCCAPFLSGQQYPKTPEKLMRSRFSAFAIGGYGQYLLDTWLPSMTQGMTVEELSQRATQWLSLNVVSKSQSGDNAMVEFEALFVDSAGERQCHHEKSIFKRIAGKWLYVGGEVE
jgi:SEC-C motif-containing protein